MRAFAWDRRLVGICVSVLLAAVLWVAPLPGNLSAESRKALIVTVFTVVWWIFNVVPPAYATLLMLVSYIELGLATPIVLFVMIVVEVTWWKIVGLI